MNHFAPVCRTRSRPGRERSDSSDSDSSYSNSEEQRVQGVYAGQGRPGTPIPSDNEEEDIFRPSYVNMVKFPEERESEFDNFNDIGFDNKGFETFSKSSSRQARAVVAREVPNN